MSDAAASAEAEDVPKRKGHHKKDSMEWDPFMKKLTPELIADGDTRHIVHTTRCSTHGFVACELVIKFELSRPDDLDICTEEMLGPHFAKKFKRQIKKHPICAGCGKRHPCAGSWEDPRPTRRWAGTWLRKQRGFSGFQHSPDTELLYAVCPHVTCGGQKCREIFCLDDFVDNYFEGDECVMLHELIHSKFVEIAKHRYERGFYCPKPTCVGAKGFVLPESYRRHMYDTLMSCQHCDMTWCTQCNMSPYHEGMSCAKAMQAQRIKAEAESDPEARKTIDWIIMNTVLCPTCGQPCSKTDGCDKMTCRCGSRFCWACGKILTGSIYGDHIKPVDGTWICVDASGPEREALIETHRRRVMEAIGI